MKNRIIKQLFSILLVAAGLLFFRLTFAQDFGLEAVNSGLDGSLSTRDPRAIAGSIINVVLGFLGVIALGLIVYAGFLWMTSGGEEEKISKAKKLLTSAVIGLVIILASWAIATFVLNRLSGAMQGGSGTTCLDGQTMACGCGGTRICIDGSWQGCVGSDCTGGEYGATRCDSSSILSGCQADSSICSPQNYCDDNCYCRPRGNVGDSCNLNSETATCNASDDRCAEFLSCDTETCTCFGPPVITGISPAGGFCADDKNKSCSSDSDCGATCNRVSPNGAPSNLLTISGKGFGEYQAGVSQVIFIGGNREGRSPAEVNPLCLNFWTDTQIVIAVPSGVTDGPIKVVRGDGLEDYSNNDYGPRIADFVANTISRPGLCALNPGTGALSQTVVYQGVNLRNGRANFGNYQASVPAISSDFSFPGGTSGSGQVPNIRSGETTSFVSNTLSGRQEISNYLSFSKEPEEQEGAYIVSFSPTQGRSGQYVTINGVGFGGLKGDSRVYFGDKEANYDFPPVCASSVWTENQVIVKVPDGIINGSYSIRMTIGGQTIDTTNNNPNVFKVDDALTLRTSVCKLEPSRGSVSTPVKVYGEYFGAENSAGLAQFNVGKNVSGSIKKENRADVLAVTVPAESVTGPVKVIKNGEWGNELNFEVGVCAVNEHCPGQVCCPANTYKKGRCVNSLIDCLIDIPTSVFEWNFSTGYVIPNPIDPTESCSTLASSFGTCQVGAFCPNVPGVCSPYGGGNEQVVGTCDYSCASVPGCGSVLGSLGTCTYDSTLNKCLKNGEAGVCSLSKKQSFVIDGQTREFSLSCNQSSQWQFTTSMSCPDGWERGVNNICIDRSSSCSICEQGLSCEQVGSSGRCVSRSICAAGAVCKDNADGADSCVVIDEANCECCCRINNSAQDCCVPLNCSGACGADRTGSVYGMCSGCAAVGNTQAEQDAACNCTGHSGQFCSISSARPEGVCTDCSGLKTKEACEAHASSCCFDAQKNICRGGSGTEITSDTDNPDYGYCAYFSCSESDPSVCAASTPVKQGFYKDVSACESGCPAGKDPCNQFSGDKDACSAMTSCCYNFNDSVCKRGGQITSGNDAGYCAYYNCNPPAGDPPVDPKTCNLNPQLSGAFSRVATCNDSCSGGGPSGAGQDCFSALATASCNFNLCNYPSMSCLTADGSLASGASDCGTCCCNPADVNACKLGTETDGGDSLYCQPNQGKCSGAGRGLCCGCSLDSDCVNSEADPEQVGCGLDTCCQARPKIDPNSELPANGATNACRNALIQVTFDQLMDVPTFSSNVILLHELNSGVCPSGTFVYQPEEQEAERFFGRLAKSLRRIKNSAQAWLARIFLPEQTALAVKPDPAKVYCATPTSVSGFNFGDKTTINIRPVSLLAPSARYYVVIKGDEELNSQLGVVSLTGVGFNGEGLTLTNGKEEGENIKFNNTSYKNSHIWQFSTLSDKAANAGVCVIKAVKLQPASYLFKSATNDLQENDTNPRDRSFDTVADRDKAFVAWAYSADHQIIVPVTGYFWNWSFSLTNSSVASSKTRQDLSGLEMNRALVSVNDGVTSGETKLVAAVNMTPFLGSEANNTSGCVCNDDICSARCVNAFSEGDSLMARSDIYVFVCNNPWPPVNTDGSWYPWKDNCNNVTDGACFDFSYKFYYCRDAGQPGTHDDLPAIIDTAIIRGQSSVLTCSLDGSPCGALNASCGADRNGDGRPDGICAWTVLKDSYFFREEILAAGEIISATDKKTGGAVTLIWSSTSADVGSYKIYYNEVGKTNNFSREFKPTDREGGSAICTATAGNYFCNATVTGLKNNQAYNFRLTVISENKAESILSQGLSATPTDQTPPEAPLYLNYEIIDSGANVRFTWTMTDASATFYRLYRGITPNVYGESFDSPEKANSLILPSSRLGSGDNYFAISALDEAKNESAKSTEIRVSY